MEAKLKVSCYVLRGGWIKRKSRRNNKVEKNQRIKEAHRAKMKSEGQISTYTLTQRQKGHIIKIFLRRRWKGNKEKRVKRIFFCIPNPNRTWDLNMTDCKIRDVKRDETRKGVTAEEQESKLCSLLSNWLNFKQLWQKQSNYRARGAKGEEKEDGERIDERERGYVLWFSKIQLPALVLSPERLATPTPSCQCTLASPSPPPPAPTRC